MSVQVSERLSHEQHTAVVAAAVCLCAVCSPTLLHSHCVSTTTPIANLSISTTRDIPLLTVCVCVRVCMCGSLCVRCVGRQNGAALFDEGCLLLQGRQRCCCSALCLAFEYLRCVCGRGREVCPPPFPPPPLHPFFPCFTTCTLLCFRSYPLC